jgi:UDP-glucose 4-epimerase
MRRDCLNPYSVSKVAAEDLCKMYYTLWGLPTIILRYFNIYGERQPLKGQYAPVIGIFLRQKEAKEALTIVGDGLQKRDFTHVSDALQANIKAMETEDSSCYGEIFNVGTGANTSVFDIAKLISNHYTFIPAREGEAQTTLADITKIKSKLGYSPQVQLKEWIAGYGGT